MTRTGIGSVLPPPELNGAGIFDNWVGNRQWSAFRTARAALSAFLRHRRIQRIWLPAYICPAVTDGVKAANADILWYATDQHLRPDTQALSQAVTGDAILCVGYFGRSPSPALRDLAHRRRDLVWIEDRAQALSLDQPAFGDVCLYSPRKLFGVGDGGLLVADTDLPQPSIPADAPADNNDWIAPDKRAQDPHGRAPLPWFTAFRQREANMDSAPQAMSARTLDSLRRLDAQTEAEARRRNWACLAQRLSSLALWPDPQVAFTPLAYPLIVPDAAQLAADLSDLRIWCARHWPVIPAPEHFRQAHQLARQCLSLPLDGRYTEADMVRITDAVETCLHQAAR